jgi:hypothetical protein
MPKNNTPLTEPGELPRYSAKSRLSAWAWRASVSHLRSFAEMVKEPICDNAMEKDASGN